MADSSSKSPAEATARTQAERSATSDKALLDAAIDLILERGIEKTTLQAIGARAGYSRGLATYRFGSKAGLFDEVAVYGAGSSTLPVDAGEGKGIVPTDRARALASLPAARVVHRTPHDGFDPARYVRAQVARAVPGAARLGAFLPLDPLTELLATHAGEALMLHPGQLPRP